MHVVVFAVELDEGASEVLADVSHDAFTVGEDGVGECPSSVFGDKHQVDMTFPHSMSACADKLFTFHDTKCSMGFMLKRYRYRAYPTRGQRASAVQLFGCVRVVWNDALAARENARKQGQHVPTRSELSAALTKVKKTPERSWLSDVSAVPLQQSLADLDRAYRNFFDSIAGKRKGRKMQPPRFRKRANRQSARFTRNAAFKVAETTHGVGFVTLPKIGRVRYAASRPLPSEPSSVTLIREPDGRFYVSFVVEVQPQPEETATTAAGVDVGLADLATVTRSDGSREKHPNPRWLRAKERKLARAQRALARTQRGSANREKARKQVAICYRKVREARLDHHHKLALHLVRENQTVAVEGLSIAGLAKTRLAKSVHDAGWATFFRLLKEKADQHGRTIITIDQWEPTTQTCSVCGTHDGKKPLAIRTWACPHCNTTLDRDYNAAVNIMVAAGLAETLNACGGSIRQQLAVADPKKQEPTEQTHAPACTA